MLVRLVVRVCGETDGGMTDGDVAERESACDDTVVMVSWREDKDDPTLVRLVVGACRETDDGDTDSVDTEREGACAETVVMES